MVDPKDPRRKKPVHKPRPNATGAKRNKPPRKPRAGQGYVPRGKLTQD